MSRPDFLLVAPDPTQAKVPNPGGQLTAMRALKRYADATGLRLAFIDTLQASFPAPSLLVRAAKAISRQLAFVGHALFDRPRCGVLIFAAGPASFVERAVTGVLARLLGVRAAICLRSGDVVPLIGGHSPTARLVTFLLRLQPRIVLQGSNWLPNLDAAGFPRERVKIVPNWLDPRLEALDSPIAASAGKPLRFVFVGWLVADKGVRELIFACSELAREGHDFRLELVGDGTLRDEIETAIAREGLESRVILAGWLTDDEVCERLAASDVFVLPTYFEGFPNVLLEAFAAGLPAIATAVGGIPDSLRDGDAGYLVAPGDAQDLARAMRRFIEAPEIVERHSARALAVLREKHDFERNCQALLATLER